MRKKTLKRALSAVLSASMVITGFTVPVNSEAAETDKATKTIKVSSYDELKALGSELTGLTQGEVVEVNITKDISAGENKDWLPIAIDSESNDGVEGYIDRYKYSNSTNEAGENYYESVNFPKVIINGNGHKIENLTTYYDTNDSDTYGEYGDAYGIALGFIGEVKYADVEINNLDIEHADFSATVDKDSVVLNSSIDQYSNVKYNGLESAGLIAYADTAEITINDCRLGHSVIKAVKIAGGLVGDVSSYKRDVDLTITNSNIAECNIQAEKHIGGAVGYATAIENINVNKITTDDSTNVYGVKHPDVEEIEQDVYEKSEEDDVKYNYFLFSRSTKDPASGTPGGIGGITGYLAGEKITITNVNNQSAIETTTNSHVGGVAGYVSAYGNADTGLTNLDSTITGCTNGGNVKVKFGVTTGGIAGISNVTVTDVENTGDIAGAYCVGGLIGNNSGTLKAVTNESGEVVVPTNSGAVNGFTQIGGNVGYNSSAGVVEGTTNTGKVTGSQYVGGIVGQNEGTVQSATEDDVVIAVTTNSGDVEGIPQQQENDDVGNSVTDYTPDDIGGNVGRNLGNVKDVVNNGKVGCYALDEDTGENLGEKIGGNVGYNQRGASVIAPTNTADVTGGKNVGGNVGKNDGFLYASETDDGTTIPTTNTGNVTGEENVGGNAGYNSEAGEVDGAVNEGDIEGDKNTAGNIGLNEGAASNLVNKGDVHNTGDNTGGNIGYNTESGEANTISNSGNVTGEGDNTGGNIGLNEGTLTDAVNTGNATGKDADEDGVGGNNVGGNVGNNGKTGVIEDIDNYGKTEGVENVDGNVGLDNGTTKDSNDYYNDTTDSENDSDNSQLIVDPDDPSTWNVTIEGMNIRVNPEGTGAVYLVHVVKGSTVTLNALPVLGYKFVNWTSDTEPTSTKEQTATFAVKEGATITANFELINNQNSISGDEPTATTNPDGSIPAGDLAPVVDIDTGDYVTADGLTIKTDPVEGGKIKLLDYNKETKAVKLSEETNDDYVFVGWIAEDEDYVTFSTEDLTSKVVDFTYKKGAVVVAKFRELTDEEKAAKEKQESDPTTGPATTETPKDDDKRIWDNTDKDATSKGAVTPGAVSKGAVTAGAVTKSALATGSTITIGDYIYMIKTFYSKESNVNKVAVIGTTTKELKEVHAFDTVTTEGAVFRVVQIGNKAFKGLKKATYATVGKNVKVIGKGAFAGDNKVAKLKIKSNKLKNIKNNAFKNMKSLKKIVIKSKKLKKIGKNIVKGDKKLKQIKIKSKKIKMIGKNAFTKGKGKKLKVFVPAKKFKKYKKLIKKSKSKKVKVKKF